MKISRRILGSIFLTAFAAVVISAAICIGILYNNFMDEYRTVIETEARYIASIPGVSTGTNEEAIEGLSQIVGGEGDRITLIGPDGTVLYDTDIDEARLENHIDRNEVEEAMENGSGSAVRVSETFGETNYYYALKLKNGNILRIAATTQNGISAFITALPWLIFAIIILLIGAWIVAKALTNAIIKPINCLDLDDPISSEVYDELSPLTVRMDRQNKEIFEQMSKIYSAQKEFEYITENMSEGLIVLGKDGTILSMNRMAQDLFDINGKKLSYIEVCREPEYVEAIEKALRGEKYSSKLKLNGREYSLSAAPVEVVKGRGRTPYVPGKYAAVMFIVDITEKEQADKLRREFSANVSHELKTPLTSIMGCAEIMINGIAKPEARIMFLKRIHSEASRLLALIEDIIQLSQLDEQGFNCDLVPVNVLPVCENVIKELELKAEKRNVTLIMHGHSATALGNERLMHEMIYNLCDNAIMYNKDGGSVKVTINENGAGISVAVEDTGVGIAKEDIDRIFERFYRVDKSHSKDTGGTGLGLSIVKHAAMIQNAEISVDSEVGEGTRITVLFKKAQ